MAFGQETMEQLYRELAGGHHLSAKLHALLEGPLDGRGLEEAVEVSRELRRVFMVSLYMLRPYSDSRVDEMVRAPPPDTTRTTDNSICLLTPTKDKRIRREEVSGIRRGREEMVTRTEITQSPHKDGCQWRKYGQKIIQNSNFPRYYFKCTFSRDRRCAAKKQVQRRDGGEPPVYLVTYLNEHTCQLQAAAAPGTPTTAGCSPTATSRVHSPPEVLDSTWNSAGGLYGSVVLPHADDVVGGAAAEENAAIVTCLATVIGGAVPPTPPPPSSSFSWKLSEEARPSGGAGGVPAAAAFVHSPSADGSVADEAAEMDCFPYDVSTLSPVEVAAPAPADHHPHLLIGSCDVPLALMETVWPHYTNAWR
ncbi:hypothetical protein GUJ93_ZPchr0001g29624 [Zizania palustris]|uniref:WRKY domain-containing protein n=1 Tax=Zizania palustris TaxID=103762 RepID=A0A8J5SG23_ZIZPA|nr:hypothetical protein GUJ93_ZPchr0001g29624 [Zizania palustris]